MLLEKLKGAAPRLMDASTLSPPTPGQVLLLVFLVYFLADLIVLLMSPILYFLDMSVFEPRELP